MYHKDYRVVVEKVQERLESLMKDQNKKEIKKGVITLHPPCCISSASLIEKIER